MNTRTVYSTVTNGHGDLSATSRHRRNVARMVRAANRMPCHTCATNELCDHGLEDNGLFGA